MTEAEIAAAVTEAFEQARPLRIAGGGSRAAIGRPVDGETIRPSEAGITLYQPDELVIGARAGTPLAEVEAALAEKGQMLAFEPADHRALLGTDDSRPTVGGLVASNLSGPRRVIAGACRDGLIGVSFVNGRGEVLRSGGRVMKNVTGYDLVKLVAGSWGTLGVVTEAIFKVVPRPETEATLVWPGLFAEDAVALMSAALGSPYEVSAAAHVAGAASRTALRLENFAPSVAYRTAELVRYLARFGAPERLDADASAAFWRDVRDLAPLRGAPGALWRVSVAPSKAFQVMAASGAALHLLDWGGGLMWLAAPESPQAAAAIVAAARGAGGHAMLYRGSADYRRLAGGWVPLPEPLAAIAARVKAAFDPAGILNPGLMG
jgi:glycolate oxidase FAD binding subunit